MRSLCDRFPAVERSLPSQQLPSLPIPLPFPPLPTRSKMQTKIPSHRRERQNVPAIPRDQINRKEVHRPIFIKLPPRPMHIQAVRLNPPPPVQSRLHLHPQNPPLTLHPNVITSRIPIRLRNPQSMPRSPSHKTKLRPLPPLLAILDHTHSFHPRLLLASFAQRRARPEHSRRDPSTSPRPLRISSASSAF
jgi:hypothetical protein